MGRDGRGGAVSSGGAGLTGLVWRLAVCLLFAGPRPTSNRGEFVCGGEGTRRCQDPVIIIG
eukprot:scaffold181581_cov28-Tisochrysis_lutea.AAC.1